MAQKKNKYYTLDAILKKNAQYNMIIGKRSNGKTYAWKDYGLRNYFEHGSEIAYIRRWGDDFRGNRGATLFNDVVANGLVEKYSNGVWTDVYYFGAKWYFCRYVEDANGNRERIKDELPFCYAFSLNGFEHDKSSSYPNIRTIVFEEFLTRQTYLTDEFIIFMNVISTVARDRLDVKIFMVGNTVNKYCPYFSEMGLTHIKEQKDGEIDLYQYGDSGLKVAVEYTKSDTGATGKGNLLFAFDNPKLQMITHGNWEIDIYPHLPYRYKRDNIIFQYFIQFDGETLHCEIIRGGYDADGNEVNNILFTYVHLKTTEIKDKEKDVIFSTEANPHPNYYKRLTQPSDKRTQKIAEFFKRGKVFYQSNEVGELLANYLKWCKS